MFLLYWLAWFITGFNILDRIDRWWIFLTNWGVMVILINFLLSFGIVTYGIFGEPASKTQPGNPVEVATVSEVVESNPSKDQSKQGTKPPISFWSKEKQVCWFLSTFFQFFLLQANYKII